MSRPVRRSVRISRDSIQSKSSDQDDRWQESFICGESFTFQPPTPGGMLTRSRRTSMFLRQRDVVDKENVAPIPAFAATVDEQMQSKITKPSLRTSRRLSTGPKPAIVSLAKQRKLAEEANAAALSAAAEKRKAVRQRYTVVKKVATRKVVRSERLAALAEDDGAEDMVSSEKSSDTSSQRLRDCGDASGILSPPPSPANSVVANQDIDLASVMPSSPYAVASSDEVDTVSLVKLPQSNTKLAAEVDSSTRLPHNARDLSRPSALMRRNLIRCDSNPSTQRRMTNVRIYTPVKRRISLTDKNDDDNDDDDDDDDEERPDQIDSQLMTGNLHQIMCNIM